MKELSGKQIETLRIGLQIGFREPSALEMFLREKLDKPYVNYVGARDKFPEACFNIVTSSQSEGWRDNLILEANKAHPKNLNIIEVGFELGLIAEREAKEVWSQEEEIAANAERPLWRTYNPYRGLLALREQDANYLFGRDEDVDRFVAAIETDPSKILLALGASGVGKSSLIFAGVLGALKRRVLKSWKPWPIALEDSHKWPHLVLTPGTEPVYSLAGAFVSQWIDETEADFRKKTNEWRELLVEGDSLDALVKAADAARKHKQDDPPSRYLIYVDQGEELYTRGGREPGRDGTEKETAQQKEARRYSELLAGAAVHPRLIVLMSVRSDFLGQLQADKRRADAQSKKIFDVHLKLDISPLSEEGLARVVLRPAELLGVTFASGLNKALVTATREEIGGLPLLSDTLESLWQEMQARDDAMPILRWNDPEGEAVDITKKLAERADAFVKRHKTDESVLRRLFCVCLAHVPVQGEPTRQRAYIDDLSAEERDFVDMLAGREQRILVTGRSEGQPIAEVAHEKLFTAWQTLQNWIESRRGFYAWATQIETERNDWENAGELPENLLIGRPLERARSYLEANNKEIQKKDAEFILKSINKDIIRHAEEKRKKHLATTSLRIATITVLSAVISGVFAVSALLSRIDAVSARDELLMIQSTYVADLSLQQSKGGDFGLAALLALEAFPNRNSIDRSIGVRPYWLSAGFALGQARRGLREQRIFAGHERWVSSVAVTRDGSRIVTGSHDKTTRVWDTKSGRELYRLGGHTGEITSVVVTPDGRRIITGSSDKTALIWDAASGRLIARLLGHKGEITSVVVMADGRRIVTGSSDGTVRMWATKSGRRFAKIIYDGTDILSVAVTTDGSRIVTGSSDQTARVWDVKSGRELSQLRGHTGAITSVVVTPDGKHIVTGSSDKTARIWDATRGRELARLTGHEDGVRSVAVTPDGLHIITGSSDKTARIWDAASARELKRLIGHVSSILGVAVTPDGSYIVTGSSDNTARIWDTASSSESALSLGQEAAITSVAAMPGESRAVTGSSDGTVRIWNATSKRELARFSGHVGDVTSVAVTSDGSRIVTGSYDKTARIWDATSGRELARLIGHEDGVADVAVTPDGSRVVTGSYDNTARIWDAVSGRELARLTGNEGAVWSVAVTPDGSRIVTGSYDKTARIWNAVSGNKLASFVGHNGTILGVAVTPDGSRIVTGSYDKTARVWDVASGRELAQFSGHGEGITSVAITPDGSRVVTGSSDKTVRIWDVASGRELERLTGHDAGLTSVAITPDGDYIVTGSWDKTARFWRLFPIGPKLIDEVKLNIPRCLTAAERARYYLSPTSPRWCYEMGKWPYDATTLMIDGRALLFANKFDEALSRFAEARKQNPSLGVGIDMLLANVKKKSE